MAEIKTICSVCKKVLGITDSFGAPGGISHGLCPKCGHSELVKAGLEDEEDQEEEPMDRDTMLGKVFGVHNPDKCDDSRCDKPECAERIRGIIEY